MIIPKRIDSIINRVGLSADLLHDPNLKDNIVQATKLTPNISLSRFTGGRGDASKIDPDLDIDARKQLARNLVPHSHVIENISKNRLAFNNYEIEVAEGLYLKEPTEEITPDGLLDLRTNGRAVVYEIIGPDGTISPSKTFEAAIHLSKTTKYDKIILDYDNIDPSGELNVQIVVTTPEIPADYESATFKMGVETHYNNTVVSASEFVEILPDEQTNTPFVSE